MGCSLSCYYFDTFSTLLEWVVYCLVKVGGVTHYPDDFLFLGPSSSPVCLRLLEYSIEVCFDFGIPLAHEKMLVPLVVLNF